MAAERTKSMEEQHSGEFRAQVAAWRAKADAHIARQAQRGASGAPASDSAIREQASRTIAQRRATVLGETTASQAQPRSDTRPAEQLGAIPLEAKPNPGHDSARGSESALSQQGLRQLRLGLETQLASHERARAAAAQAIEKAERRADEADEVAEQTVAALAHRTLELQKARVEIAELRVAHRHRDEAYSQLTERVEGLVAQLDSETQNAAAWRQDIGRLQAELEEARAEARRAQVAVGSARAKESLSQAHLAAERHSSTADADALVNCRAELARLRQESAAQAAHLRATQEELNSAREHAERQAVASARKHDAVVAELREQQRTDRKALDEAQQGQHDAVSRMTEMQAELAQEKEQQVAANASIAALRAELISLRETVQQLDEQRRDAVKEASLAKSQLEKFAVLGSRDEASASRVQELELELEVVRAEMEETKRSLVQSDNEQRDLALRLATISAEKAALEGEGLAASADLAALQLEVEQRQTRCNECERNLLEKDMQLEEERREVEMLKSQVKSMEAHAALRGTMLNMQDTVKDQILAEAAGLMQEGKNEEDCQNELERSLSSATQLEDLQGEIQWAMQQTSTTGVLCSDRTAIIPGHEREPKTQPVATPSGLPLVQPENLRETMLDERHELSMGKGELEMQAFAGNDASEGAADSWPDSSYGLSRVSSMVASDGYSDGTEPALPIEESASFDVSEPLSTGAGSVDATTDRFSEIAPPITAKPVTDSMPEPRPDPVSPSRTASTPMTEPEPEPEQPEPETRPEREPEPQPSTGWGFASTISSVLSFIPTKTAVKGLGEENTIFYDKDAKCWVDPTDPQSLEERDKCIALAAAAAAGPPIPVALASTDRAADDGTTAVVDEMLQPPPMRKRRGGAKPGGRVATLLPPSGLPHAAPPDPVLFAPPVAPEAAPAPGAAEAPADVSGTMEEKKKKKKKKKHKDGDAGGEGVSPQKKKKKKKKKKAEDGEPVGDAENQAKKAGKKKQREPIDSEP